MFINKNKVHLKKQINYKKNKSLINLFLKEEIMKKELFQYLKLIFGLFISAMGSVLTIKSNLGLSPWDVLHQGLSLKLPITIGQGNIIISVIVMLIAIYLGEVVGSGSILATFLFGIFMDMIIFSDLIKEPATMISKIIMILGGVLIFSYGTYLYISVGLGSGPRDSLMTSLSKKTKFSAGRIRNTLEIAALTIGYFLGGSVGVGTVISALLTGFFLQLTFNLHKFEISFIKHRDIKTEFSSLLSYTPFGNK